MARMYKVNLCLNFSWYSVGPRVLAWAVVLTRRCRDQTQWGGSKRSFARPQAVYARSKLRWNNFTIIITLHFTDYQNDSDDVWYCSICKTEPTNFPKKSNKVFSYHTRRFWQKYEPTRTLKCWITFWLNENSKLTYKFNFWKKIKQWPW